MLRIGVWGGLLVLGGCVLGCNAMPLTASLWSEGERRDEAASYLNQGVRALKDWDLDRADRLLARAALLQDEEGEGVLYVVERLLDEVKPDTAVLLLEKAIQQPGRGNNPLYYGFLARAYTMLGQEKNVEHSQKSAEELVRSAQELLSKPTPLGEPARQEAVRLLLSAGRYCVEFGQDVEKAVTLLRRAVERGNPNRLTGSDRRVMSYLGVVLAEHPGITQDRGEAVSLTRRAARKDPQNPELLAAHGVALLHQGDFAGAQCVLREAADLDSNNADIRCYLGQAYARQALFAQAALELDRALLIRPKFAAALRERKRLPNPLPDPVTVPEEEFY